MNPLDVITILLSIVGIVAVTEIAMWLFVVIWQREHRRFDSQPLSAGQSCAPNKGSQDRSRPRRISIGAESS